MPEKPPRHILEARAILDNDFPVLDDNDVWLYQHILERFIDLHTAVEDNSRGRYKAMLACLGAQARRKFSARS